MSVRLNIAMDEELYKRLKKQLPSKRVSAFINDAVRTRLYPDKRTLDAAYKEASREGWRRQLTEDWNGTEVEDCPSEKTPRP